MLLTILEHARLRCALDDAPTEPDAQGGAVLARHHFEALRRWDERLARAHDQDTILEWSHEGAKARQWVGVVQAPGLTLEILPKLARQGGEEGVVRARAGLLSMLALAGEVPLRERDSAPLSSSKAPLSETLVALFARRLLEALQRGKVPGYEAQEEPHAPALRGRLHAPTQIRRNAAHRERFAVVRDDFTEDTPLYRALKAACRALLPGSGEPGATLLRRCLSLLEGVSEVRSSPQELERVALDRRHDALRPVFALAKLILGQEAPGATVGKAKTLTLLFDMNAVFERFVGESLRRFVLPSLPQLAMHRQAKHQWRYLLEHSSTRKGVLRLEPDVLITDAESGRPLMTLDVKWKLPSEGRREARREDLYQVFAYAQRYGCRHNVLLYPSSPDAKDEDLIAPAQPDQPARWIGVRHLDVQRDLGRHRAELCEALRALLDPVT
jgi:5-methylcytosine-specific restriction enzyme subunit McrC